MTTTDTTGFTRDAVRRGYDALIAAGHTPEAIRAAVLAEDLEMCWCQRCVIGNLYGLRDIDPGVALKAYDAALDGLYSGEVDVEMGFDVIDVEDDDAHLVAYRRLADEWRLLIAEVAS